MRMQDTAANCGPASLSNALAALGIVKTQQECERLCKTTAQDGTSQKQLAAGARLAGRYGSGVVKHTKQFSALVELEHYLRMGRPMILCVDSGEHWVAAIGMLGHRFLVADPADNELVLSYDGSELARRWVDGKTYMGVLV